jgi:hypothetical protein
VRVPTCTRLKLSQSGLSGSACSVEMTSCESLEGGLYTSRHKPTKVVSVGVPLNVSGLPYMSSCVPAPRATTSVRAGGGFDPSREDSPVHLGEVEFLE